MDKLKQWVALTLVGCLAVLAAGWFLLVSPRRSDAADLREQADSQLASNRSLQLSLASLKAQAKDLPRKQAQLAAVAAKIPDNPALPALIRSLTKAASDAGVDLVSLAPSTPAPVAAVASTTLTPAAPAAGGTTSGTGTAAPKTPVAGAVAAAGTSGALQQIPVVITVVGRYFQIEQFFDQIEDISRALKVSGFQLAPGTSPAKVTTASTQSAATDPGASLTGAINALVYMSSGRMPTPTAPVAGK